MKARLIKTETDEFYILCNDGSIAEVNTVTLNHFLFRFLNIEELSGNKGSWKDKSFIMSDYPGKTCASVSNSFELIIIDPHPFKVLFTVNIEPKLDDLISSQEYAKLHGRSVEQIKVLCRNNRLSGAVKVGRDWVIPADAPYPLDERISGGRHTLKRK